MHLSIRQFIFSVLTFTTIASCRKGNLPEPHYFGKVNVTLMELPGTPKILMYFGDKRLDTLKPAGNNTSFLLQSGQSGRLKAYDAEKNEFLADTLINILPDSALNLRFVYSKEFGLKTFTGPNGMKIPQDSIYFQVYNGLGTDFYPKEKYTLQVIYLDPATGEIVTTPTAIKDWERGKLNPLVLKFAVKDLLDKDGNPISYAGHLIDPETGNVVTQPDGFEFLNLPLSPDYAGKFWIINIGSNNLGEFTTKQTEL
jgi:hypothetical protein